MIENLDDYLSGELSWGRYWLLRMHLWVCRHCRAYNDSYQTTVALVREAYREDSAGRDR